MKKLLLLLLLLISISAFAYSHDDRYSVFHDRYNSKLLMVNELQYPVEKIIPGKTHMSYHIANSPSGEISKWAFFYGDVDFYVKVERNDLYCNWYYTGYIERNGGKFIAK